MEQLSLVIFSICIQAAIGIMLFIGIGRLLNKDGVFRNATLLAAALGIVGMSTSLLHLGRPMGAIRALNHFATSWLSREIWFTSIFVGLVVVTALLVLLKPENKGSATGLTWVAAIVGLVDVFVMASIYSTTSAPIWQGNATFVEFYAAAISMGAVLFLLLSLNEAVSMGKIVALATVGIVVIQVAVVVPSFVAAGSSTSLALQRSLEILAGMGLANSLKWIAILAGASIMLWLAREEKVKSYGALVTSGALLLLVGQIVGRYLFYVSVVVTGIGLS